MEHQMYVYRGSTSSLLFKVYGEIRLSKNSTSFHYPVSNPFNPGTKVQSTEQERKDKTEASLKIF